ncbi:HMA2 domain-containing protein [Rhodocyclus tenuis]|uniref:Copper chaperone n=1 Tax=Rhodocyclus tenuis TaxID=1066 RepID=A0A840GDK3_RHOTE|nr:hypothetical protein [Rhodocyclus tenuis]MBB4248718.1 hypothetical protein [Rhodocyclus tenuis]MBK1680891.1 hypothetical protein [Rhodocyclus tenuis]
MSRIVSATPGRIRIRDKGLRQSERLARLEATLGSLQGITECTGNRRAGSLLLRFDPTAVDMAALEAAIDAAVDAEFALTVGKHPLRRKLNRYAKIGMLGSMAATLAFAASGNKRLHTAAGTIFVGCMGVHMYTFRHHLLR